jgi:polyketide synthase PksN
VYVVIGGAGGVGEAWTEALLRRMPAQVVWIGRRPKDADLQARLDRLAALGPAPLYLTADATDREQLAAARDTVKRAFGRIDGVIHAAIVLRDRSLANMAEEDFAAGLAAKAGVSVRLAQAFAGEPLDFVLFFSSMLAFLKWPGQSNYVAGCAFGDAFAERLAAAWPARVRVVNWGYWGGVGAAASERHQSIMARRGFGSIGTPGAMRALDGLVAGAARQLLYLELLDPTAALEGVAVERGEQAVQYEETLPSYAGAVALAADAGEELPLPPGWTQTGSEIDGALARLLGAQLQSIGPGVPILDRFGLWWKRSFAEL